MNAITDERLIAAIRLGSSIAILTALWFAAKSFPSASGTSDAFPQYLIFAGTVLSCIGAIRRREYWSAVPWVFLCAFVSVRLWTTWNNVEYVLPGVFFAVASQQMFQSSLPTLERKKQSD